MENLSENYGDSNQPRRSYELDITKINTLEDLKAIFGGLGLRLYENTPQYSKLSQYFCINEETEGQTPLVTPEIVNDYAPYTD